MHGTGGRYRRIAGLSLLGVGIVSVLGIITAEALYPGYDPTEQTISALGAATDGGTAVQPAASVFNGAMLFAGLLSLVGAYALHRTYRRRVFTAVLTASGLGVAGVGVFPAHHPTPHLAAALVTFVAGGLAAVLTAVVARGPFRYVAAGLGVVSLAALGLFLALGGTNPLGVGGLERWITYPTQLWALGFGGYLLGDAERSGDG